VDYGAKGDQQTLVAVLRSDLELGRTFALLARRSRAVNDIERFARSLQNARKALLAIRRYEGKITDANVRDEIHKGGQELEILISKLAP
jgi:hypothetical protein